MTFKKIIDGKPLTEEQNPLWEISLNNAGLALINQHIERLVDRSNDGVSPFAEAYVSAGGRNSSVVTAETSALFDTNKYKSREFPENEEENLTSTYTFEGTTIDTDVWDSTVSGFVDSAQGAYNNQFDDPDRIRTRSQVSATRSGSYTGSLTANQTNAINLRGQTIIGMDIQWSVSVVTQTPSGTYGRIYLKLTDNSTDVVIYERRLQGTGTNIGQSISRQWVYLVIDETNDLAYLTLDDGKSFETGVDISSLNNAQDWWLKFETGASHNGGGGSGSNVGEIICYEVKTGINAFTQLSDLYSNGEITHTIPAGTFSDTVSSGYAVVDIADWEDGASLTWEAYNGSDSTGELPFNIVGNKAYCKISQFTEFLAQAENYKINLIPKETNPTAGYPSIRGSAIQLL